MDIQRKLLHFPLMCDSHSSLTVQVRYSLSQSAWPSYGLYLLCFCVHDFIPTLPCFLLPCANNNFFAIHNTGDFRRSSVLKSLVPANCANYLACIVHHQGIRSYYPWREGTVVVRSVSLSVCLLLNISPLEHLFVSQTIRCT